MSKHVRLRWKFSHYRKRETKVAQRKGQEYKSLCLHRKSMAYNNLFKKNAAKRNMSSAVCSSSMYKSLAPTPSYMAKKLQSLSGVVLFSPFDKNKGE